MKALPKANSPSAIDWSKCRARVDGNNERVAIVSEKAGSDEAAALIHTCVLATCQYSVGAQTAIYEGNGEQLKREVSDTAMQHVISTFQRVNPQDPLEEMLLTQAIVTHARMMWLNRKAMCQEDRSNLHVLNAATDRAANTYRQQMVAFREYRRPSRSFVAVHQTNVANQQVVQMPL